jgi:hypothetical protein
MTRLREVPNCRELKRRDLLLLRDRLVFLDLQLLDLESSVDRGIPSFAASPSGPATLPLHSAKAASIISFSWCWRVSGKGPSN